MTQNTQEKNEAAEERSKDTRRFGRSDQRLAGNTPQKRRSTWSSKAFVVRSQSTNCVAVK